MELLRFITCGSVDDGKSTLIGRMLYDSNALQTDLLEAIQESSRRRGNSKLDLSLLTDGLKSEREQGITIDVAYKYFFTPKRKYIIADTPGHFQYTRNMVTAASTADLAIILVDARKGIIEQTRRHIYITHLLGLSHLILAINKMDLIDYSEARFLEIQKEFFEFSEKLNDEWSFLAKKKDIYFVPLSALEGDNVVMPSAKMKWYKGKPLLATLDHVELINEKENEALENFRFLVQGGLRPHTKEFHDYRGYTGVLWGGRLKKGTEIKVIPSGQRSRIKSISVGEKEIEEAFENSSITITLEDELDINRGDFIVKNNSQHDLISSNEFEVELCWMDSEPLKEKGTYLIRHGAQQINVSILSLINKVDIQTLKLEASPFQLNLNEFGRVRLKTQKKIYYDFYNKNKHTGSFILIDSATFSTIAAGMFLDHDEKV